MNSNRLETIGTISWLLMDFCWLSEYKLLAWIFSISSIIFTILSLLSNLDGSLKLKKESKKSEVLLIQASLMWVMMNSTWMWSEDTGIKFLLTISKVYFIISVTSLIMSIIQSRKEGGRINLKRLKLN